MSVEAPKPLPLLAPRASQLRVLIVASTSLWVGCTQLAGYDGFRFDRTNDAGTAESGSGGTGAGPADASDDRDDGGVPGCRDCNANEECFDNRLCVARTVELGDFGIDATEVTRDQYAAWLATTPNDKGPDPACSTNDLTPEPTCLSSASPSSPTGQHPQVCVDWCDAYAYCRSVGKRLCGKIGGGETPYADFANATSSQWYSACTAGGVSSTGGSSCNGSDSGESAPLEVGSVSSCATPDGVFDMSGNVWEWEDSCEGSSSSTDLCRIRGGAFRFVTPDELRCDWDNSSKRNEHWDRLGFRCCTN